MDRLGVVTGMCKKDFAIFGLEGLRANLRDFRGIQRVELLGRIYMFTPDRRLLCFTQPDGRRARYEHRLIDDVAIMREHLEAEDELAQLFGEGVAPVLKVSVDAFVRLITMRHSPHAGHHLAPGWRPELLEHADFDTPGRLRTTVTYTAGPSVWYVTVEVFADAAAYFQVVDPREG